MPSSILYSLLPLLPLLALSSPAIASPVVVLSPPRSGFPHTFEPRSVGNGSGCTTTAQCTAMGYKLTVNSHYLCKSKKCSFACNTGYVLSGSTCVKAVSSSSSSTTSAKSSTTSSSSPVTVSTTQATVKVAVAVAHTCNATVDCANTVPANAHRLCSSKKCTYKCNTGYTDSGNNSCNKTILTSSTSAAKSSSSTSSHVATTTMTTTTTSAKTTLVTAAATQTCTATADCTNTVTANAHRLCSSKKCVYKCNTGYSDSGSSCVKSAASVTTSSTSSSRTSATTASSTQTTSSTSQTTSSSPSATSTTISPTSSTSSTSATTKASPTLATTSSSSSFSSSIDASIPSSTTTTSSTATSSSTSSPTPAPISSSTSTSATTTPSSTSYSFNNTPTRTFSTTPTPPAATPVLRTTYTGADFLDSSKFWFFDATDPTGGTVNYLSRDDAVSRNLTSVNSTGSARLSADSWTSLASGVNRDSVRLSSVDTVGAGTLVILDAKHLPTGCGTWSSFWAYGDPWPTMGEIDVMEGVSNRAYDSLTIHTVSGCSRNRTATMSGSWVSAASKGDDCSTTAGSLCSVKDSDVTSYGAGCNAAGGGVFALRIAETGITIWHWQRSNVAADVDAGAPRPQTWGTPVAVWGGSTCDTRTYFDKLWLTFNIDVCGRMAAATSTWKSTTASGSCYAKYPTCADAAMDPAAFTEAYFDINYLSVYDV